MGVLRNQPALPERLRVRPQVDQRHVVRRARIEPWGHPVPGPDPPDGSRRDQRATGHQHDAMARDALSYRQTGDGLGLSATFPTLIGAPQIATGTGFETVEGRVIGRDLLTQSIQKAPLGDTSTDITTGRLDFEYWATQGAAKPAGVTAIRPPLISAANYAQWAQDNWTARDFVDAKFNADRSQAQLSIAITNINAQVAAGNVQNWLAFQTTDNVRLNGCRL